MYDLFGHHDVCAGAEREINLKDTGIPNVLHYGSSSFEYVDCNYDLYFYLCCNLFCFILGIAKGILYEAEHYPVAKPLKIITCYTMFLYLGVARNAWVVCENKKHLKYMYFWNIYFKFITILGAFGAATAQLITQIYISMIFPALIKNMCPNARMIVNFLY